MEINKTEMNYDAVLKKLLLRKDLQTKRKIGELSSKIRPCNQNASSIFVGKTLSNALGAGDIKKDDELICRVCLKEGHKYIFDGDTESIAAKINDIACLNITNKNNRPKYICDSCYTLLQNALLFRKIAQESERRLQDADGKKEISIFGNTRDFGLTKDEPKVEQKSDHEENDEDDVWVISDTEENTPIVTNKAKFKCKICSTALENNVEYSAHMLSLEHRKAIIGSVRSSNNEQKSSTPTNSVNKTSASPQKSEPTSTSPQKSKPTSTSSQKSKPTSTSSQKSKPTFTSPQKSNATSTSPQDSKPTSTSSQKSKPTFTSPQKSKATSTSPLKSKPTSASSHDKPAHTTYYVCEVCGLKTNSIGNFKDHIITHTNQLPFPCPDCPYRARRLMALRAHRRIHTGERPYICDHCSRSFKAKSSLNQHMHTHNKQHKYKCSECNKGFHARRELNEHTTRHHTGLKEHSCDICKQEFVARKSLLIHYRNVHKVEKRDKRALYMRFEDEKPNEQ